MIGTALATTARTGDPSVESVITRLREADRLTAEAVEMIGALAPTGRIEAETGLPAEVALRLEARRTRWDARELAAAADALASMPRTRAALSEGLLSWSQLRAIVRASREVRAEDRGRIDRLVGEHAPMFAGAEPERIVDVVEDEVGRLRSDLLAHREERAIETSFLVLQPRMTGGGSLYGEADTESFAVIAEALDAAADRPVADQGPDEGEPTLRARQRMEAFVRICEGSLAGGDGPERPRPRPRFLASIDISGIETSEAARVLWRLAGRAPKLSPLSTEVLSCDAEWAPVIFDGARPVAVGDARTGVPEKLRRALVARDQGCRFPGCSAPAAWCDCHHIRGRGCNDPCWLCLLCRRCHRRVHEGRWRIWMEPDGTFVFERRGKRYTSPPRARPPSRE